MSQKKHLNSVKTPHFKNTASLAVVDMPVPDIIKISMSQSIGAPCKPLVKKGDEVKVGQKIGDTDAFVSAPVFSSVSGIVTGIETQRNMMGADETLVVIEPDKKQEIFEGVKPPEVTDHKSLVAATRASGVVGLGGASFPTHIKLDPKNLDECKTLIVNAAECEPYITCDHRTMLENAEDLLYGMEQIMKYLELEVGYIGIEENKPDAIAHLDEMIAAGGFSDRMRTYVLPARYPKGAERVLVYEITKKTMNAGVIPAQLGIILSNVTTITAIGTYLKTGMPYVMKSLTVDGDAIAEPKNVRVPVGTLVHDVVEFCGGYRKEPKKIVLGGPMMGRAMFSDNVPIAKNNSAILAFSEEKAVIPQETACISCGRCHSVCPIELMPYAMSDAYERKDVKELEALHVMQCMECSSCSYICPARRPLVLMHKLGKAMVKEAQKNG